MIADTSSRLPTAAGLTWQTIAGFLGFVIVTNAVAVAFWFGTERHTDAVRRKIQAGMEQPRRSSAVRA